MKPELLFLCGAVFACAAALFGIANGATRNQDGYMMAIVLCGAFSVFFLAAGIDAWNKARRGGP